MRSRAIADNKNRTPNCNKFEELQMETCNIHTVFGVQLEAGDDMNLLYVFPNNERSE